MINKLDNNLVKISDFNTGLEADLFVHRLEAENINSLAIDIRVLPITGTDMYWEYGMPSIPYFIHHRNLAGGSVSVYAPYEFKESAMDCLHSLYDGDNIFIDDDKKDKPLRETAKSKEDMKHSLADEGDIESTAEARELFDKTEKLAKKIKKNKL